MEKVLEQPEPTTDQQVHEHTEKHKYTTCRTLMGAPECSPPTSRAGRQQPLGNGCTPCPITTSFLPFFAFLYASLTPTGPS